MLAQLNHLSHKEHTMDGFLLHLEEFLLLILLQNSQPAALNMSFKDGNDVPETAGSKLGLVSLTMPILPVVLKGYFTQFLFLWQSMTM